MRTVLPRLFIVAAISWSASLFLAAFAAARPNGGSPSYALALAVYAIGGWICHQRPERSFHVWAVQLPVCARCTGIYLGAALAVMWGRQRLAESRPLFALMVAAAPTCATLLYEWTIGRTPSNAIRAAAGIPLGAAVAMVVLGELWRLSPKPLRET